MVRSSTKRRVELHRSLIQRRLLTMILVTSSAIQRVELLQQSYTKKATGKEDGYEFLIKEEELMYYEFCQQVVELNKSLMEKCITSSASKWWSSKRLLGERLYYEFHKQEVELEDFLEKQEVTKRSLPRPGQIQNIL